MSRELQPTSRIKELCFLIVIVVIALQIVISIIRPLIPVLILGAGIYAAYKIFYMRRW